MDKGLGNFQIDEFFKNEKNEELKKIIWELIQQIQ